MARPAYQPGFSRGAEVAAEMTATAVVLAETLWAAQQTIALRLGRIAGTAADPAALRDPEHVRMVSEKLRAALEATLAMGDGARAIGDAWMDWGTQQTLAAEQFLLSLWGWPDPLRYGRAAGSLVETSLNIAETACAHLALEATRLGGRGLGPYHRAANANARRLLRQLPGRYAARRH